jgi:hypothetical protein
MYLSNTPSPITATSLVNKLYYLNDNSHSLTASFEFNKSVANIGGLLDQQLNKYCSTQAFKRHLRASIVVNPTDYFIETCIEDLFPHIIYSDRWATQFKDEWVNNYLHRVYIDDFSEITSFSLRLNTKHLHLDYDVTWTLISTEVDFNTPEILPVDPYTDLEFVDL